MDSEKDTSDSAVTDSSDLPIDFGTFVLSLATSALLHMGEGNEEQAEAPQVNLPQAKQTIDIIGMLRDKTRGNLTTEEQQLVDTLLYDLRLRFLAAKKRPC